MLCFWQKVIVLSHIILYIITVGGMRLMITNEEVLIKLLSDNDEIAKTLKNLYDEVRKEEANMNRKKFRGEVDIYKDYNKARDKMIKYLFKLNKQYHFMDYVSVYDYKKLINSVKSLIIGLEMFDLAIESCSLSSLNQKPKQV